MNVKISIWSCLQFALNKHTPYLLRIIYTHGYVCMYMYVHIHIHMYTYIHTYIHTYIYIYIYIYIHACMCVFMCEEASCMHVRRWLYVYVGMLKSTYEWMYSLFALHSVCPFVKHVNSLWLTYIYTRMGKKMIFAPADVRMYIHECVLQRDTAQYCCVFTDFFICMLHFYYSHM